MKTYASATAAFLKMSCESLCGGVVTPCVLSMVHGCNIGSEWKWLQGSLT